MIDSISPGSVDNKAGAVIVIQAKKRLLFEVLALFVLILSLVFNVPAAQYLFFSGYVSDMGIRNFFYPYGLLALLFSVFSVSISIPLAYLLSRRVPFRKTFPLLGVLIFSFFWIQFAGFRTLNSSAESNNNQCPWLSYAGVSYIIDRALFLPDDLQVTPNNEMCQLISRYNQVRETLPNKDGLALRLWEDFRSQQYRTTMGNAHYCRNLPLVLTLVVRSYSDRTVGPSSLPEGRSAHIDSSISMLREIFDLIEAHQGRIENKDCSHFVACAAKQLYSIEDNSICNGIVATLKDRVASFLSGLQHQIDLTRVTAPVIKTKEWQEELVKLEKRAQGLKLSPG